jgi:hypothetical protein
MPLVPIALVVGTLFGVALTKTLAAFTEIQRLDTLKEDTKK